MEFLLYMLLGAAAGVLAGLFGVGGGIAAYKAVEVLRGLTESGHDVTVVPTAAALKFVGAATWEALSGKANQPGIRLCSGIKAATISAMTVYSSAPRV